ncbi:MAG: hypothetical protein ACK518_04340 [bacterium]|jgi:hypothetical protein
MNPKFHIEDIVYFKLDKEQNPMLVVSYWVKSCGITYECRSNNGTTTYYNEFELSVEQNILTKIK